MKKHQLRSIGTIHTPFTQADHTPIQSIRSETPGTVEIFPEFTEGLDGIDGFSHLYLLYLFHQADPSIHLKVKPFLDDEMHGVFATRFPSRPNALGLSVVRLVERQGDLLVVLGVDMFDGTPLLDIKPYIPEFDVHPVTKTGWYATRSYR